MIGARSIGVGANLGRDLKPAPAGVVGVLTAAARASAADGGGRGGGGRRIQRQRHPQHPPSFVATSAPAPSTLLVTTTPIPAASALPVVLISHTVIPDTPVTVTIEVKHATNGADGLQLAFDSPVDMRQGGVEGPTSEMPIIRLPLPDTAASLAHPLPVPLPRASSTVTGSAVAATVAVGVGEAGLDRGGGPREFPHPTGCGGPLNSLPRGPATTLQTSLQQRREHAEAPGDGELRGRIPSARGSAGRVALLSAGTVAPAAGAGPPAARPLLPATTATPTVAQSVEGVTMEGAGIQVRRRRAIRPPTKEREAVDHARPPRASSSRVSMHIVMTNSSTGQPASVIGDATRIGVKTGARSHTRSTAVGTGMNHWPAHCARACAMVLVGGSCVDADEEQEYANKKPVLPGGMAVRPIAGLPSTSFRDPPPPGWRGGRRPQAPRPWWPVGVFAHVCTAVRPPRPTLPRCHR